MKNIVQKSLISLSVFNICLLLALMLTGCGEAEATDNIIKINIHDNGIGIEDEEKKNVLKPFYRIDKSRNQNVNNSGLGLAITKSLLNSINGKISLHDSSLGGLEVAIEIQN